jgi:hypothetical protein
MDRSIRKFFEWHEQRIFAFQKALRLDDYHMMWLSFFKGLIFGLVIILLLFLTFA